MISVVCTSADWGIEELGNLFSVRLGQSLGTDLVFHRQSHVLVVSLYLFSRLRLGPVGILCSGFLHWSGDSNLWIEIIHCYLYIYLTLPDFCHYSVTALPECSDRVELDKWLVRCRSRWC